MTPEKLFHELLGLGLNWKVEECEYRREEGVVLLRIVETEHLWESERSPGSGGRVKCYDHVEELVWRHLNVFEQRCEICCRLPRGLCESSGKIYRVTPPWERLSKHYTKAFEAMSLLLLREMPGWRRRAASSASTTRSSGACSKPTLQCLSAGGKNKKMPRHQTAAFCATVLFSAIHGTSEQRWTRNSRKLERRDWNAITGVVAHAALCVKPFTRSADQKCVRTETVRFESTKGQTNSRKN